MRLLLDECVDRRLAREIRGHEVSTVSELGWAGIRNGELLVRASGRFDVFVTVDRNLAFQQSTADLPVAVVILRARTNRLVDLKPLVPAFSTDFRISNSVRLFGLKDDRQQGYEHAVDGDSVRCEFDAPSPAVGRG